MEMAIGIGGWVEVGDIQGLGERRLYLRLLPDKDGRFLVRELYLHGGAPLPASLLRSLPLEAVEAIANAGYIQDPTGQPAVPLATLASYFAETIGARVREGDNWVTLAYRSQFEASGIDEVPERPSNFTYRPPIEPPPLYRPDGHLLSDEFLEHLAAGYKWAVYLKRDPAPFLAEQANVPVRTIHGWLRRARQRKILTPGRAGKVG